MRFTGFHRTKSHASDLTLRKHTPWIASPLASDADSSSQLLEQYDTHDSQATSDSDKPVFQHNHESSTVELFYDLFFVANLATFTLNHEMVNADTVKNYIGFFAILWFTWLETSLFDVRFASDSVFNRICKAASFGVMVGFAVVGALYDTTDVVANVRSFRATALILMVSRLVLCIQYGVVLFYVRKFHKVYAPLLACMATLFIAAMIFLGTAFGFPTDEKTEGGEEKQPHTYVAWYVTICLEATAMIVISCVWRVVSFKHTHLVERIGLLTLIIMGEGILGTVKSISKILQTSESTSGRDIGVITATVLLIYFIWVLYFDQIEHDRFGTIRQQIWAILHFPLHVAILLTVEGAANLVIWNIISPFYTAWFSTIPVATNAAQDVIISPEVGADPGTLADYCESAITAFLSTYKEEKKITQFFDYTQNITAIRNMTLDDYNSPKGLNETIRIVGEMWYGVAGAIFESFGIELPEDVAKKPPTTIGGENDAYLGVIITIFYYYYIAAGFLLILLAVLYWFGKTHKTWQEWTTMAVRTFFGINLTLIIAWLTVADDANPDGYGAANFILSSWHIPLVMLVFFAVIVIDNLLVWHTNKTIAKVAINSSYGGDPEANKSLSQKNGYSTGSTTYESTPHDSHDEIQH